MTKTPYFCKANRDRARVYRSCFGNSVKLNLPVSPRAQIKQETDLHANASPNRVFRFPFRKSASTRVLMRRGCAALAALAGFIGLAFPALAGEISTYAGGPGRGPATAFGQGVRSVVVRGGRVYTSDNQNHVVRVFHAKSGIQNVVAGDLAPYFGGDGGPAIRAQLTFGSSGIDVDPAGNLYIDEQGYSNLPNGNSIRKVNPSGIITTVAGNGTPGYSGDGGPATAAQLDSPTDVAADAAGNIYIADTFNGVIRKVDPSGIITTIGTGFHFVTGVTVDPHGNVLIADIGQSSIFKLNPKTGVVKRVAGNGTYGDSGDGGPATKAQLNTPWDTGIDSQGNFYIAELRSSVIRKVDSSGIITTVAGNGTTGFSGDGGQATAAQLSGPQGVAVDSEGVLYIADSGNRRLRTVDKSGIIHTVAGNGQDSMGPDGGPPPTRIELGGFIEGVAITPDGSLYTAGAENGVIRKVSPAGVVTTVAGTGIPGYSGDGGPATSAQLNGARDVAFDAAGNFYIADTDNQRIRKVDTTGIITTVAGNGVAGFSGDGGPATSAEIKYPYALEVAPDGVIYIADSGNSCVRKVTRAGIINTVAGIGGLPANTGDGGPATKARLNTPEGIALDGRGNLYISDTGNATVRKVTASGIITTVAGTGVPGFSGDSGPATAAQLLDPAGIILDSAGNLYIADIFNNRIRKVNTAGIIHTIVGTGPTGNTQGGFRGDGGPATSALLNAPIGIALDSLGNLYFSDILNQRIRRVEHP